LLREITDKDLRDFIGNNKRVVKATLGASLDTACEKKDGTIDAFVCGHLSKIMIDSPNEAGKQIEKLDDDQCFFFLSGSWNLVSSGHCADVTTKKLETIDLSA
jgi:hypothetical protein